MPPDLLLGYPFATDIFEFSTQSAASSPQIDLLPLTMAVT
jgi:hypothetical protein